MSLFATFLRECIPSWACRQCHKCQYQLFHLLHPEWQISTFWWLPSTFLSENKYYLLAELSYYPLLYLALLPMTSETEVLSNFNINPFDPGNIMSWKNMAKNWVTWICHHDKIWLKAGVRDYVLIRILVEGQGNDNNFTRVHKALGGDWIQKAFRKGFLHYFHW